MGDVAEEIAIHLVPEAPAEDAEGAWLVAELARGVSRGELLDEVGTQGFVLALAGVDRFEEEAGFLRYRMWCLHHML